MLQQEVEVQEELEQRKTRWVSRMIIWVIIRVSMIIWVIAMTFSMVIWVSRITIWVVAILIQVLIWARMNEWEIIGSP